MAAKSDRVRRPVVSITVSHDTRVKSAQPASNRPSMTTVAPRKLKATRNAFPMMAPRIPPAPTPSGRVPALP